MNRELINQIRERIDIVEFIGRVVALTPTGEDKFEGACPWCRASMPRDDIRSAMPSRERTLVVNRDRQSWKCGPCDIGGDVFAFVMMQHEVDFQTAVSILAEKL